MLADLLVRVPTGRVPGHPSTVRPVPRVRSRAAAHLRPDRGRPRTPADGPPALPGDGAAGELQQHPCRGHGGAPVGWFRDARYVLRCARDDPVGVVARYLAALAPGSYLVISHATDERSPEKMRANAEVAESSGAVLISRSKDVILRMFNRRELVDPGLVLVSYWRPDGGDPGPNADRT